MSDRTRFNENNLIAQQITVDELGRALGAKKVGFSWRCPLEDRHEWRDGTPLLQIFRKDGQTTARCHRCDLQGSPVQVYAAVHGCTEQEAAFRLAELVRSCPMQDRPEHGDRDMNQPSWPKDSAGVPIAPSHLSKISQVRWQGTVDVFAVIYGHEFEDAELLLLQMVFECFDEYREAQDWNEKIRRANEYRRLWRQFGLLDEYVDWELENPDKTEWGFSEEDEDEEEWPSHS